MYKKYNIAFFAIILPLFINLQAQDWVRQYPFENINKLQDVYVHQDGFGWAVGLNNTIWHTTDAGGTWMNVNTGISTGSYNGLEVTSGNTVYIITSAGLVIKSIDGVAKPGKRIWLLVALTPELPPYLMREINLCG